jgi:PEP-CTERM motif
MSRDRQGADGAVGGWNRFMVGLRLLFGFRRKQDRMVPQGALAGSLKKNQIQPKEEVVMRLNITTIALAVLIAAALQPRAQADTCSSLPNDVANCGFETGDFTSWTLAGNDVPGELGNLYGVEGTDPFPIPSGTAPNSGAFQAFFADQFADPITLSQLINTSPGELYTISFFLAQELVGPGTVNNSIAVNFGGTGIENLINVPVQGYTFFSGTATATTASTLLSFQMGNDVGEFLLDDVSVTTPEPSTWMLLLTGGLVAGVFYRRQAARATR